MRGALLVLAVAAAGCGNITRKSDDGGVRDDGRVIDARVIDAGMNDGPPADAAVTPSSEIVSGAGRATSSTYTIDVQIGHPVGHKPVSGATYKLEGNAAVKP